jgi:hypothetical protein
MVFGMSLFFGGVDVGFCQGPLVVVCGYEAKR